METCSVAECDRPVLAKNLCKRHYDHARRHDGDPTVPVHTAKEKGTCNAGGCEAEERTLGLCGKHYMRARRNGGDPDADTRPRNPTREPCKAEGCTEPSSARGYCKPHYMRLWRHGEAEAEVRPKREPVCTVEGCGRPHFGRGYCAGHHARWRAHGDPGPAELGAKTPRGEECTGPECSAPVLAKNLCATHYEQQRQGKSLTAVRTYKPKDGQCEVAGCGRSRESEGLCGTHYARSIRGEEDWDRPIKTVAPAGSGHTDAHGYRIVTHEGRTRREHHVIAEQLLGRRMLRTEEVHHLNGHRADNRTNGPFILDDRGRLISGNLDLWSKAQPAGQEVGPKLDWAAEMIEVYGDAWLPTLAEHPRLDALVGWARELLALYAGTVEVELAEDPVPA